MKTEQYKAFQSKFFEGNTNTEEEQWLKQNANPGSEEESYFRAIQQEKQETFNLNFEDFLAKTEDKKVIKPAAPKLSNFYWLAAAMALVIGTYFVLQQNNFEQQSPIVTPVIAANNSEIIKQKTAVANEPKTEQIASYDYMPKDFSLTSKKQVIKKRNRTLLAENKQSKPIDQPLETLETDDYNPNYVVVNGRAVTNEEEALNYTKEAFAFFAKNVTNTLETANIENISE